MSDSGAYCRQIEAYLCRQNGGHLVRIVGPAFEKVSEWARRGVPLKVVYRGIDRYVQRQLGRSTRRRPARIEFCEADVLDVFDEWKRAVGTLAGFSEARPQSEEAGESADSARVRGPSLPSHLARVQVRVSSVLAGQRVPPRADRV